MNEDENVHYRMMSAIAKIADDPISCATQLVTVVRGQGSIHAARYSGSPAQVRIGDALSEGAKRFAGEVLEGDHRDIVERAFARFKQSPPASWRKEECCRQLLSLIPKG